MTIVAVVLVLGLYGSDPVLPPRQTHQEARSFPTSLQPVQAHSSAAPELHMAGTASRPAEGPSVGAVIVLAARSTFWICGAMIVYTYFLYPLVLVIAYAAAQIRHDLRYLLRQRERRVRLNEDDDLPGVSIIVPAYNEGARLEQKAANLLKLDYPADKLEVVFVSDGSTDGSNEYLRTLPAPCFQALILPHRRGKANALNQGVAAARHEVLIMCDTSTVLPADAARKLARRFRNLRTGLVCASLRYTGSAEFQHTEGVYWNFESMLRIMEGRLGATLTASGPLYAMRKSCYRPLPETTLIDDFVIAANVRRAGCTCTHDPEVIGWDTAAPSVETEFLRRVRLATGSFRALPYLLRTPLRGFAGIAFFSHKLLRWMLPFLLIGLLVSNILLVGLPLYQAILAAQLGFYAWAGLGYCMRNTPGRWRLALLAYFVVSMNAAFLVGFARAFRRPSDGTWQRVN